MGSQGTPNPTHKRGAGNLKAVAAEANRPSGIIKFGSNCSGSRFGSAMTVRTI